MNKCEIGGLPPNTVLLCPDDEQIIKRYNSNPLILADLASNGLWRKTWKDRCDEKRVIFCNDLNIALPIKGESYRRYVMLPKKLDDRRYEVIALRYDENYRLPDGDVNWHGNDPEMVDKADRLIFEWNDQGTIMLGRPRYTVLFCQGCVVTARAATNWIVSAKWNVDTMHPYPVGANAVMGQCIPEFVDTSKAREELAIKLMKGEAPIRFNVTPGEMMEAIDLVEYDIPMGFWLGLRNMIQDRFDFNQFPAEARRRFRELLEKGLPQVVARQVGLV